MYIHVYMYTCFIVKLQPFLNSPSHAFDSNVLYIIACFQYFTIERKTIIQNTQLQIPWTHHTCNYNVQNAMDLKQNHTLFLSTRSFILIIPV